MKQARTKPVNVLVLLSLLIAHSHQVPSNSTNVSAPSSEQIELDDTVRLITGGETSIKLRDDVKDVVLVVGMTGAGKTTLTKFIAEPSKLESYKIGGRYLIQDVDKEISINSTVVSKTIFPNLILDTANNIAFYDMPGFSDTRNVSVEIANAWFMKTVADHAERVKIIFIAARSTLTEGGLRKKIVDLLTHASEFIKNPAKFKHAISLVVSKVDSSGQPHRILGGVAAFLNTVKTDLTQVIKDAKKRANAADILNAFLQKDANNNYTRISYFLQPKEAGKLTDQPRVMERRASILHNLVENTRYESISPDDFGISISDRAKLLVSKIAQVMTKKISTAMVSLSTKIVKYTQKPSGTVGKLLHEQRLMENFYQALSSTMSRQEFTQALQQLTAELNVPELEEEIHMIQNREKNLAFFETVRGERFPADIQEWSRPMRIAIESANSAVTKLSSALNAQMKQRAQKLNAFFQNKFHQQIFNAKNSTTLKQQLSSFSESLQHLMEDVENHANTYNQFVTKIRTFLAYQGEVQKASKLSNLAVDVNVQGPGCREVSLLKLSDWLPPFESLLEFIEHEQTKVKKRILDEIHRPILKGLNEKTALAEKNITEYLTKEDHALSTLKTEKEQEEKVYQAKMQELVEKCKRDVTNLNSYHEQEEDGWRTTAMAEEAVLKKEVVLEKQNTARVEANSNATETQLEEELRIMREQQSQLLKDERQRIEEVANTLKHELANQLVEKEKACRVELDDKKAECNEQKNNTQTQGTSQIKLLQSKIERRSTACEEEKSRADATCTQEIEGAKSLADQERKALQTRLKAEEESCSQNRAMEDKACNDELSYLETELSTEKARTNETLSSQSASCDSEIQHKNDLHKGKVAAIQERLARNKANVEKDCASKVLSEETKASEEFQKKKDEYIKRWKDSGSCCYTQKDVGSRCRDGTAGTPCCSPTSCTYVVFTADFCHCGDLCRM